MPPQQNGIFADVAFTHPADGATLDVPILVAGGSTAAYSATLGALQAGVQVCLVQPEKLVGGQFTAQGLSASDDSKLLQVKASGETVAGEEFCLSRSQRQFRERQRQLQPVNGAVWDNPGGGWVSPLCTTPVVAATALNEAIAPYLDSGQLTLIPLSDPVAVLTTTGSSGRRRVTGVTFRDRQTGHQFTVTAQIVIEATDLGDLLELGQIESRVGQEARHETGEARLPTQAHPECQQAITFNAAVERLPDDRGAPPIGVPDAYGQAEWLNPQDFGSDRWSSGNQPWGFYDDFGIFRYRRIFRTQAGPGGPDAPINKRVNDGDVSLLNWGIEFDPVTNRRYLGNDYVHGVLVGVSRQERQQHIQRARDRARAYVHYLQTNGFGNLKPRGDLTWTGDGIAIEPYIREARRGIALTTITHEKVGRAFQPEGHVRAHTDTDTVGIGDYHYLDVHPNQDVPPGQPSNHVDLQGVDKILPFTIPLGSLIPQATDGLVLSAKSLGTTHITNSAYRMHPVEWAIGEAGGHLAAYALKTQVELREVTETARLRQLQGQLTRQGIPLFWFDDVSHDDPDFEAIQVVAAAGIIRSESFRNLHFRPENPVNRAVVATAIVNLLAFELQRPQWPRFWDVPPWHWAYRAVETLAAKGVISGIGGGQFAPDRHITRKHMAYMVINALPEAVDRTFADTPRDDTFLRRRELSRILYAMLQVNLGL